ncbi:MAG: ATP12 family protein [Sphingomonadaceae bacterium]|nr:molecular chaperone [Sphingomonadaceae bacterium]
MKRFYKKVSVAEADGGWRVLLDGRAIKTAQGAAQVVPTPALAEALAEEWRAQGEEIDLKLFALRDAVDFALDLVAPDPRETIERILAFAETDTLCYRGDPDEPLFARQQEVWEPLLTACEHRHDVRFERISGIIHRAQPPETLARLRSHVERFDPFTLSALQALSSLSASLVIALEALREGTDGAALWDAANLEELWQIELWGEDFEAKARREKRGAEFARAMTLAELVRG